MGSFHRAHTAVSVERVGIRCSLVGYSQRVTTRDARAGDSDVDSLNWVDLVASWDSPSSWRLEALSRKEMRLEGRYSCWCGERYLACFLWLVMVVWVMFCFHAS